MWSAKESKNRLAETLAGATNVIRRLTGALLSLPWTYDLSQRVAGSRQLLVRLRQIAHPLCTPGAKVVDIGGGTGIYRKACPDNVRHMCFDPDPVMLAQYRAKHSGGIAVQCDGAALALGDRTVDLAFVTCVLHHLADEDSAALVQECRRILKPGRHLVFAEPLWAPSNAVGRILWRFDRGSHPRTSQALRTLIEENFSIREWKEFRPMHNVAVCLAVKE